MPESERADILSQLSIEDCAKLVYDWRLWARPNQLQPEGDLWSIWMILAGRGFGKTRTGAETVRDWVQQRKAGRICLLAEDAADARDVMVEGPAGIMSVCHPSERPRFEPSKRRLSWRNGALATIFSSADYEALRGPQHDGAWVDELAKMRYQQEAWDNLMFGLRLGRHPRVVVTTTPRPTKLIKTLIKDPTCFVTRGSTYENLMNLAPVFRQQVLAKYEGTRLGRQELEAEIIMEVAGALWTYALLDQLRVKLHEVPALGRKVVAIDPAVTSGEEADDTGLIVAGRTAHLPIPEAYLLEDRSNKYKPAEWAQEAIRLYKKHHADAIVAEVNNGGEMIEHTIHTYDPNVRVIMVHATRGKHVRAEPVSALYEQGRIHHVGTYPQLEDQLCEISASGYTGSDSPDRADAVIWGMTELMLSEQGPNYDALTRM